MAAGAVHRRVLLRALAGPVRTWLTSPSALTALLTAALALLGAGLVHRTPQDSLLPAAYGAGAVAAALGLGAAFFLTELGQALVEVRRQAYSFSMSGVPLVIGLLYLPPSHLVAVRLVAAVAAFLVQRTTPVKLAFNTASFLLDTALVITLVHLLVDAGAGLSLGTALRCYAALAVVDVVMSSVVLLVIRINSGPVGRGDAVEVLGPAAVFVALNTAVGFIAATLWAQGALGVVLLLLFAGLVGAAYRGYLVLRRRHSSLQLVHDFVQLGADAAEGGDGEEARVLEHLRSVLRASRVELHVLADDGAGTRLVVDEGSDGGSAAELDPSAAAALCDVVHGQAVLLPAGRTGDAPAARLLGRVDEDALVVPLPPGGLRGVVLVVDRIGDAASFTPDDLSLAQTLVGHLGVALRSSQLLRRLRHEAGHDVLTGLANRALLAERMQEALADGGPAPAVLLLDLDRFKEVNDALGHHVGDELLHVVAARLRDVALPGATVARLGGDEFAVLLPSPGSPEDVRAAASRVQEALAAPVVLPEGVISTHASIGVAHAPPGTTEADLLRHADTAMYAAKSTGAGITVYTDDLDRGRAERLALLSELHQALDADALHLHFQPKLELASGAVTSVEALVRWTHPRLGPLAPDVFVPLAESTGLVDALTRTVLRRALRQCRDWRDAGVELAVAVNLSARNVGDPDLPDQVLAALAAEGLPPHLLILEITESSVMGDPEVTLPVLHRLAATGVTLSLDDFGTGYSSLAYLQRLPVRELKIDRSFVRDLDSADPARSAVLVRAVTGLGASLGLRVVAEGVESAGVLEQLRELGCDVIQGYHVGRPVEASALDLSRCRPCAPPTAGAPSGVGSAVPAAVSAPVSAPVAPVVPRARSPRSSAQVRPS